MTPFEKKLWNRFLDDLHESMQNCSCNEYRLPNTPEVRALLEEMIKSSFKKEDQAEQLGYLYEEMGNANLNNNELRTFDTSLFAHLRNKVEKIIESARD